MTGTRTSDRVAHHPLGKLSVVLGTMLTLALSGGSLVIPSGALAQKMCIPPAGWVAYLSGPPRWWDGEDQNGMVIPSYDPTDPQWDPRWVGARADGYGGGTTNDARFRALFNVENGLTYLYMSWFVNVAPTFSQQNTSLYVGLSPSTANATGTIFQATFDSDTGNVPNASSDGAQANPAALSSGKWTVIMYQGNGQLNWNPVTPAWFTDTKNLLSFQNTARAWANPGGNHQWAVNLRIPIDPTGTNGVNIGNALAFKIWFYIQPDLTVGNMIGYIPYTWPRTGSDVTTYVVTTGDLSHPLKFPDPSDATNPWSQAALELPETEGTCRNGVALEDDEIGTTNTPSTYINPSGVNTFFAAPSNYGPAVSPQVIRARFRMANWGSALQPGTLTGTSWNDIPNLSNVLDMNGIAAGTSNAPTQGNITGNIDFTSSDPTIKALRCAIMGNDGWPAINPPIPPDPDPSCTTAHTLDHHQCILVSLTGSNVDFIRDIAFHNMDFQKLDFAEAAEISIKGLPPLGAGRDVYIFLETRNMPSFLTIGSGIALPTPRAIINGAAARQGSVFDSAVHTIPSYVVHSYYDTGKTVTIKGVAHPLYQPLTSFGYFVEHTGLYFGWQPSVQGAPEIASHYYKITIPNGGAVKVNSTINAIDLTTWWIWLIVVMIVLIVLFIGWLIGWAIRRLVHT
jgi:hypothetical protein